MSLASSIIVKSYFQKLKISHGQGNVSLIPWWTWSIIPLICTLFLGFLSDMIRMHDDILFIYLPIPAAIIFIHWWGVRVLPSVYLATIIRYTLIGKFPDLSLTLLIGSHVAVTAFTSWVLFNKVGNGKTSLPNLDSVVKFIITGIIIPISINAIYEIIQQPILNSLAIDEILFVWTADLASSCALVIPSLFFFTPYLATKNISIPDGTRPISTSEIIHSFKNKSIEIFLLTVALVIVTSFLSIKHYWYVSGVLVVFIAIRFGFGFALMSNLIVFIFSYIRPFLVTDGSIIPLTTEFLEIHQGICLLSITAAITGRVVSDLRNTQKQLNKQNTELRQAHVELDRFVYSVSHDLSAPLKSILGLINLSRLEKSENDRIKHINLIEKSVLKLDRFIHEILDYSRNSRLDVKSEKFSLKELIDDIIENLRYSENFNRMKFDFKELYLDQVHTDRMRLRIVLHNLISNAITYQNIEQGSKPTIIIRSQISADHLKIEVQDNGSGIREDILDKIFNMFYRGSLTSSGSGLGLYIAKEAVELLDGKIVVQSVYGLGSNFIVYIPLEKSVKI